MKIRKSTCTDVKDIMVLVHQAQNYFKENNIDQWQDGYPNSETILDDYINNIVMFLLMMIKLLVQCILL